MLNINNATSNACKVLVPFLIAGWLTACGSDSSGPSVDAVEYYPPVDDSRWEHVTPEEQGWNTAAVPGLLDYVESSGARAFIVLAGGRIVIEEYFKGHTASDLWQWNSAGKTLVTAGIGISAQQGLVGLDNPVSSYLGSGWTSAPTNKEELITVRSLLSMTSGLDDEPQRVVVGNLNYIADAGTRWAYGNVFQELMNVVAQASEVSFADYFQAELGREIGLGGFWNQGLIYTIYHSTARDMARFGLLALHNGRWQDKQVVSEAYFRESTSTSQAMNPSYGFLWWLNGKTNYMLPGSRSVFDGALVPNAPSNMVAAMGLNEQRLYVVPGLDMVVVRMGESAIESQSGFALSSFDETLWDYINSMIEL